MKILSSTQTQAIAGGAWADGLVNTATATIATATAGSSIQVYAAFVSTFLAGAGCLFIAQRNSLTMRDGKFAALGGVVTYLWNGKNGQTATVSPEPNVSTRHRCFQEDCSI